MKPVMLGNVSALCSLALSLLLLMLCSRYFRVWSSKEQVQPLLKCLPGGIPETTLPLSASVSPSVKQRLSLLS